MAKIREILAALETSRTEMLERMETLQNKLDQSPGPQQMTSLREEMAELRTKLETAETEKTQLLERLATLEATRPAPPANEDGTPEPAPAPGAKKDAPEPASPKSKGGRKPAEFF